MTQSIRVLDVFRLFAEKTKDRIVRLYKLRFLKDEFTIEVNRWFEDCGDSTLRLDYPDLNGDSIVFDVGGYKGEFAFQINQKYGCTVYLFEPHPQFYKDCVSRFIDNDKIIPLNFGLSDKDGVFFLSESADGSSFLNPNLQNHNSIRCEVKEFFRVMKKYEVDQISLLKINIEGGEFPLLEHIANRNCLDLIEEYQIQFHNFVLDAGSKRDKITQALEKTHNRTWCYTFVWENWKRKR